MPEGFLKVENRRRESTFATGAVLCVVESRPANVVTVHVPEAEEKLKHLII